MNKDIKKLNDLGNEFHLNKINVNEFNNKFNEFFELYKKVLLNEFKEIKNFKLIEIKKRFLYLNGYFRFNNKTYFFSTINLIKFEFDKNNIIIKEVEPKIDYINKSLSKSITHTFFSLNKRFIEPKL